MRYELAGRFELILAYLALLISAGAFVFFAFKIFKCLLLGEWSTRAIVRCLARMSVPLVASSVCCWFFYTNMFTRFSGVLLRDRDVSFGFFWPKSEVVIPVGDIVFVRLEEDRRHRGEIVVGIGPREMRSIVCLKSSGLEDLRDVLMDAIAGSRKLQQGAEKSLEQR